MRWQCCIAGGPHNLHVAVEFFFIDKCASFWPGSQDKSQTMLKVVSLLPGHNTTLTTVSSAEPFCLRHVCLPLTVGGYSLGE